MLLPLLRGEKSLFLSKDVYTLQFAFLIREKGLKNIV